MVVNNWSSDAIISMHRSSLGPAYYTSLVFYFSFIQTNLDLVWIKPISSKIGTLAMPYEHQPSFWAPFYVPTIRQKAPLFKKHCEN